MMGTGEYTTGFVDGKGADSDKSQGVVGLVCLDLMEKGKISRLGMCGTNGLKIPGIMAHMDKVIGQVYEGLNPRVIETWPKAGVVDRKAFKTAAAAFKEGDCAIIFTPDDTHFEIALECIERGMHVMITKPPVKTLEEHRALAEAATRKGVLCVIEVHKRFDPMYLDACDRIQSLGPFSFFTSYMSQPKHQLDTFKAWAGKSSDISYYLNSHHVDFHNWVLRGSARPLRVTALSSTGVANARLGVDTEDTTTLSVQWENLDTSTSAAAGGSGSGSGGGSGGSLGHALYTSSWIAPKGEVHSQQRWFYMGQKGEINVDQAHRGYTMATDAAGFGQVNPLFWKPTPSNGKFAGQRCYGYISFEAFVEAADKVNAGLKLASDFDHELPTMATTVAATAILEAGRRSLDSGGRTFELAYDSASSAVPVAIVPSK